MSQQRMTGPGRRNAERGATKRVTISLVLPAHQANYLRNTAKQARRSISAVASELIEEAIFGKAPQSGKAS